MGCTSSKPDPHDAPGPNEVVRAAADSVTGVKPAPLASQQLPAAKEEKKTQEEEKAVAVEDVALGAQQRVAQGLPYEVNNLGPPPPPCDSDRLETIKALRLDNLSVEAPPDPEIENILKLVCSIFSAPHALCALFDDKRVFVREAAGGGFKRGDFPWRYSFCGWTMASQTDQILVVEDAKKDARFCDNVNVTCEGGVRFYCGAPLIASNGHRLGTLCFADHKPRIFEPSQASILGNFAEMVVRHVEKDIALQLRTKDNDLLSHAYRQLKRTIDCFEHCVVLVDTSTPGWNIMYTNSAWDKTTGCRRDKVQGQALADVMDVPSGPLPSKSHRETVAAGKPLTIELVRIKPSWLAAQVSGTGSPPMSSMTSSSSITASSRSSGTKRLMLKLRPASTSTVDEDALAVGIPSWVMSQGKKDGKGNSQFYFITVETTEAVAATARGSMLSGRGSSASITSVAGSPLKGLNLGQLLGSGSFGSVYAGHWYGTPVAIKVIDQDLKALEAAGVQMEAVLGSELRHPHIVATLTYAVHTDATAGGRNCSFDDSNTEGRTPNTNAPSSITQSSNSSAQLGSVNKPLLSGPGPVDGAADAAARAASAKPMLSGPPKVPTPEQGVIDLDQAYGDSRASLPSGANISSGHNAFTIMEVPSDYEMSNTLGGHFSSSGFNAGDMMPLSMPQPAAMPQRTARAQTWIVLEFCDKGCLQDAIDRGWLRDQANVSMRTGQLNMASVVSTACEVASALQYLHAHGIVHGDLSAWNILLTTSGSSALTGGRGFIAKVADFGLSRSLNVKTKIQTKTYGTITHQPPETLLDGHVSRETDTYSLGVLMWQMYTGSRPWAGLTHAQIIMCVASRSTHLTFPAGTPKDYETLAMACLSYDVKQRPSMATVCTTLELMKQRYLKEQAAAPRASIEIGTL